MTRLGSTRLFAAVGAVVLAVLLASLGFAVGSGTAEPPETLDEPVAAPRLRGPALDGGTLDLREHRGSVVLVNVWASWCAPCREELPLLVEAARRYDEQGLVVLGVNTNDRRETAQQFLEQIGAGQPVRHIYDPQGSLAVAWGTRGLPETFVVDRQGRIVARHFGEIDQAWLTDVVVPRLEP